jgi:hypothetical protein
MHLRNGIAVDLQMAVAVSNDNFAYFWRGEYEG